jgi:hypothetical protein
LGESAFEQKLHRATLPLGGDRLERERSAPGLIAHLFEATHDLRDGGKLLVALGDERLIDLARW